MKTYVMNGVDPNPHEHYPFIRKFFRELLHLLKLGIPVINIHGGKREAYFFKDGKQLFLGTSAASQYLMESPEDKYIVDYASDWELTLFNMWRDRYGMWHAKDKHVKGIDLLLGTSASITFEKIILAERFFMSKRPDKVSENANDSSLAFEVSH